MGLEHIPLFPNLNFESHVSIDAMNKIIKYSCFLGFYQKLGMKL